MNMMKHIQTWLQITLLALSANGAVSAKVASGPQNLDVGVHQSQTVLKALMHQRLEQVSTTSASGSPLATKGGKDFFRGSRNGEAPDSHQGQTNLKLTNKQAW